MNNTGAGAQPDVIPQRQTIIAAPLNSTPFDSHESTGDGDSVNGDDEPPSGHYPIDSSVSRYHATQAR